jgi:glutamate:Na+ symporter, ESS family
MITGVVVGSALVRWAVGSPKVEVMRNAAPTAEEDYDIDRIRVAPAPTSGPPRTVGFMRRR